MNIRSNEPFGLLKKSILYSYPSLHEDLSCEILIIGGGITGALMAHACIKNGFDTILIDKREIAHGSTSATTSMLQYEIDIPLHRLSRRIGKEGATASYEACRQSIGEIAALVKETGSACDFEYKQSLYFAGKKKDIGWLKTEYEHRKQAGFEVEWLEGISIKEQYGLVAEGGICSADGGSIDAFQFTHDILHYNHQKGLRIFDKTEVTKIRHLDGKVIAGMQTKASVSAKYIIYCTGYEAQDFLPEKIVNLKSTYAIVSEKITDLPAELHKTLFWNTDSPYLYLRSTAEGRILIGGEDEDFRNPLKRDGLLDRKREKLLHAVHRLLPDIHFIDDFAWCGTFGETKDGLPYIGTHQKFPNSYFCLGFGGNGITFSVMGANMIVNKIKGKAELLSHFFRFGR